jgi:L-ascorbate metabolism protein UlaG (beta-lactamase superfamily)
MSMRRTAKRIALAAGAAAAAAAIERRFIAAPRYRGPLTDHFDGQRFHNAAPSVQGSFLKWMLTRDPGHWNDWTDAPFGPPPPRAVGEGELRVTFINHATTLIQIDGINILTDPIWSDRTSPIGMFGPRRHRPPGIRFEDLPPIDLVLVSHNHYDHLDIPTLKRLTDSPIVTPLGNAALMRRYGIFATELDWWQSKAIITLVPAQHFCSRGISDRNRNLWGGFVISSRSGNVYFAGDTGWGEHFAEIAARFQPVRLALLPIGAYLPRWFMRPVHINPEEAVKAHGVLEAQTSIAIHFGCFHLGDDGEHEPVRDLKLAIAASGNPRFWVLDHGEGRDIPPCD